MEVLLCILSQTSVAQEELVASIHAQQTIYLIVRLLMQTRQRPWEALMAKNRQQSKPRWLMLPGMASLELQVSLVSIITKSIISISYFIDQRTSGTYASSYSGAAAGLRG